MSTSTSSRPTSAWCRSRTTRTTTSMIRRVRAVSGIATTANRRTPRTPRRTATSTRPSGVTTASANSRTTISIATSRRPGLPGSSRSRRGHRDPQRRHVCRPVRRSAPKPDSTAWSPGAAALFDEGGPLSKITTLRPRDYGEARTIGERFRDGTPVIMDLVEMSNADAKRLVDFAAGLAFALRGSFDKVATKVFLLSPADIDVSAEERRASPRPASTTSSRPTRRRRPLAASGQARP